MPQTSLPYDLVRALEKTLGDQAHAEALKIIDKERLDFVKQLRARGIVVNASDRRDGMHVSMWTALDEIDRLHVALVDLKTKLIASQEALKAAGPGSKMLQPRLPKRQGILKKPDPPPPPRVRFVLYECGICDHVHLWGFTGDCRDDSNRFRDLEDYCQRSGTPEPDVELRTWDERCADQPKKKPIETFDDIPF